MKKRKTKKKKNDVKKHMYHSDFIEKFFSTDLESINIWKTLIPMQTNKPYK